MSKSKRNVGATWILLVAFGLTGCNLPQVKSTNETVNAGISQIYSSNGTLMSDVPTNILRLPISYSQLGPLVAKAVVAIEDKRFWNRGPIDIRSIVRAALANLSSGSVVQGGSTIEEQLVKIELGTPKRTLPEKLHEILLSLSSLTGTTHRAVLTKYLNDVYLGEGTYGVQAASQRYYSLNSNQLDLYQAATLAGLINAPSAYDPLMHPSLALQRRNQVLYAMYQQGQITKVQYVRAKQVGLELNPSQSLINQNIGYFAQATIAEAETLPALGKTVQDRINLIEHGGIKIYTTEDQRKQAYAHLAIDNAIPNLANRPSGALVSINPTNGAVEALVGGLGYGSGAPYSDFNMATQGQRPAGSTFKVIALAEALSQNISPTSVFYAPKSITIPPSNNQPAWTVSNYEGEPSGYMTLTTATILSVNTVYAQLIKKIGSQNVVNLAHAMGVQSTLEPYDSIVLGSEPVSPMDMASVYATLADYGTYNTPYLIQSITNSSGGVIYSHQLTPRTVLSPAVAATETSILQKVMIEGTGVNAGINRPAAGKTGTGENWDDAWFDGYVPQLATAVWVGFPAGAIPMTPPNTPIYVVGGSWPARAFAQYNSLALAGSPIQFFKTAASFKTIAQSNQSPATTTTTSPNYTVTPNVIGMPSSVAQSQLKTKGVAVSISFAPSGEYPPGYTTSQTPSPGTPIRLGSIVKVTVANVALSYPSTVAVPNLLGLNASQAAEVLSSVYLTGGCTTAPQPSPTTSISTSNSVWEQQPAPGTQVALGTSISCMSN